uniref:Cilia- and flagella-associated protein 299 n=1 Tax=Athene cunicularia TaxID=194338 RepID=A0A663MS38_ATHCN
FQTTSEAVVRQLVELGFRGSGDVLRREEFEARAAVAAGLTAAAPQKSLASVGKELKNNFLQALAEREEANRTGKISVSTLFLLSFHGVLVMFGLKQCYEYGHMPPDSTSLYMVAKLSGCCACQCFT